jgi:capsular exopolysaccharide synthesis family protein
MLRDALLRHPFVFVASLLVCVASGYLAGRGALPVYTASATLLIQRQAEDLVTLDDLFNRAGGNNAFSQTQVALITSSATARRVIENEDLLNDPAFTRSTRPPKLWTRVQRWGFAIPRAVRDFISGGEEAQEATPEPEAVEPPSTEEEGNARLRSAEEKYLAGLTVLPVRNTDLVTISWSHPDAELAARVVNATTTAYIEMTDEARAELSAQMSRYLGSEISRVQNEIAEAEAEQARLMPGNEEPSEFMAAVDNLAGDYAEARAERIQKQIRHDQLAASDPDEHPEVRANGSVLRLQSELEDAEEEYAELLRTFTESYPPVEDAKSRIDSLTGRLQREEARVFRALVDSSRAELDMAEDREQRLQAMLDDRREELAERNGNLLEYQNLQMRIQNAGELLETLVARQAQTDMSARLQGLGSFHVRVVEAARAPRVPSNPARSYVLFSIVAGLMLGAGAALLLDYLDDSLVSADDAERYLGLPGLVVVPNATGRRRGLGRFVDGYGYDDYGYPYLQEYARDELDERPHAIQTLPAGAEPALGVIEHPRSAFAESYRALRTRLLLADEGQIPRAIALTSSAPGEGKTTAAVNLAAAFAAAGKKTLLVDADLRRPNLHRFFGLRNRGLVEVLGSGRLESAVQATKVKGLWLLAAGGRTEQPNELLSSPRFRLLIAEARRRFDLVIVDTSPLLAVVDGLMVVASVDATLVVVRRGATSSATVDRVCNLIEESGGRVLGILLNEPEERRSGRGHRGNRRYSAGA